MTLVCNATGNPAPTLSWTRDGSPVDTSGRISFSDDEKQLTITNVSRTDSGEYRCVANNSLGNKTSNVATLDVQCEYNVLLSTLLEMIFPVITIVFSLVTDQPKITVHPKAETISEGKNVTLSCNATGNPAPTLSWTRDGSPVDTSGRISFSDDEKQLTITNVSRTDSGEYRCLANNSLGNKTSNVAILDVQCEYNVLLSTLLEMTPPMLLN